MSTLPTEAPTGGVEFGGDFAHENAPKTEKAPTTTDIEFGGQTSEAIDIPDKVEAAEEASDDAGDEGEEAPKKGKGAKERITELNAKLRETERALERERIKSELRSEMGLQPAPKPATVEPRVAPNPSDLEKYPLGALDDRYVEDKIQFGIDLALGSVLQRQQEDAQQAEASRVAAEHLKKAEDIVSKGAALHDDYNEVVWEAGRRGDYSMSEPTFHAITEAEHGAEIAYALASDKAEAARVAGLSPYGQVAYVAQKNAEFAARKAVKLPKAGSPPVNTARGTGSPKSTVAFDTEDLGAVKRMLLQR